MGLVELSIKLLFQMKIFCACDACMQLFDLFGHLTAEIVMHAVIAVLAIQSTSFVAMGYKATSVYSRDKHVLKRRLTDVVTAVIAKDDE